MLPSINRYKKHTKIPFKSALAGLLLLLQIHAYNQIPVEEIILFPQQLTIELGHQGNVFTLIHPTNATNQTILWHSNYPNFVSVDQNGIITALAPIEIGIIPTITATDVSGTISAGAYIEVPMPTDYQPVLDISLSPQNMVLEFGHQGTIMATVSPASATVKTILWSSDKPNRVSVNDNGIVRALAPTGTSAPATITATNIFGNIVAHTTVTVPTPVARIRFLEHPSILNIGETTILPAEIIPNNATNTQVTWSTNPGGVLQVLGLVPGTETFNPRLIVRADGIGDVQVQIRTVDGNIHDETEIFCTYFPVAIRVESEGEIVQQELTMETRLLELSASVLPGGASQIIKWSSSNESVLTVSQGGLLTARCNGTAQITVSTDPGFYNIPIKTETVTVEVALQSGGDSPWTDNGTDVYTLERRVGIEVLSPKAALHINSIESENALYLSRSDNNYVYANARVGIGGSSTDPGLIFDISEDNTHFTNAMFIRSDGNVGIGTINPTSKLTVDGDIKAERLEVKYNVSLNGTVNAGQLLMVHDVPQSDYVFEKDYELMEIPDLKEFVTTNKHLPEIPSAVEFQKNGYTIGEMDNVLLRKIEELTLYIIELQDKVDQLKETNEK